MSASRADEVHCQVFDILSSHFGGQQTSTELQASVLLRREYPGYEVTCTSPAKCDLFGYAKAGHATATTSHGERYDVSRLYEAPKSRKDGEEGALHDHARVGRWEYTWREQSYLVYEIEYMKPNGLTIKLYYILAPRLPSVASSASESHLVTDASTKTAKSATDDLLLAVGKWTTELHDEIYVFDDSRWRKDKKLHASVLGVDWSEIILSPILKRSIIGDITTFFSSRALYASLGVPWKRGLILHGSPGNGKTLSIKALINMLQSRPAGAEKIPSLYVKSFDDCMRGPKHSIREIFNQARAMSPCLLIFEDLDSLVTPKIRAYFLNEVDGLEANDGICMIGSTNHLETLDPAIAKRPSRFDRKYHFGLPNQAEREAYCEFWRGKVEGRESVEFTGEMSAVVARMTEGFSFAYLKELFLAALLSMAARAAEETKGGGERGADPRLLENMAPLALGARPGVGACLSITSSDPDSASSTSTQAINTPTTSTGNDVSETPDGTPLDNPVTSLAEKGESPCIPHGAEIPVQLRENVLFQTICEQITLLRGEMGEKDAE